MNTNKTIHREPTDIMNSFINSSYFQAPITSLRQIKNEIDVLVIDALINQYKCCSVCLNGLQRLQEILYKGFMQININLQKIERELRLIEELKYPENISQQHSFPFKTMRDLMNFENCISSNPVKYEEVKSFFQNIKYESHIKYLQAGLRAIFTDELLNQLSWFGTEKKKGARSLRIISLLNSVYQKKFPTAPLDQFDAICIKYIRYSNNRLKTQERKNRRKYNLKN